MMLSLSESPSIDNDPFSDNLALARLHQKDKVRTMVVTDLKTGTVETVTQHNPDFVEQIALAARLCGYTVSEAMMFMENGGVLETPRYSRRFETSASV